MIEAECFDPKVAYLQNFHNKLSFYNIRFHKLQKGYYQHQS